MKFVSVFDTSFDAIGQSCTVFETKKKLRLLLCMSGAFHKTIVRQLKFLLLFVVRFVSDVALTSFIDLLNDSGPFILHTPFTLILLTPHFGWFFMLSMCCLSLFLSPPGSLSGLAPSLSSKHPTDHCRILTKIEPGRRLWSKWHTEHTKWQTTEGRNVYNIILLSPYQKNMGIQDLHRICNYKRGQ